MWDKKLLYDAILGSNDTLYNQIWPTYKRFLEETKVASRQAEYLDNSDTLINDFYRWLAQTSQTETLALIDRRKNPDRRAANREGVPGRRGSDQ